MLKTSIIILTYNSEKYISKLIESIYKFNSNEDFEILVVDNSSSDKTVEQVNKLMTSGHPNLKVYETGSNLGFSKGINFGAKKASGKYLLFVNPDSFWKEGSIGAFLSVFEHFENVGIVGGMLESHSNIPERSAGKFLGFWASLAMAFGLDNTFGIRFEVSSITPVDFVSGGFMMVEKDLFEKLAGFDEHYFMYVEDMDLCFRAKRVHKLTYTTAHVVLAHAGQGSSNISFAFREINKGITYFQKKFGNPLSYAILKVLYTLKSLILVMISKLVNN